MQARKNYSEQIKIVLNLPKNVKFLEWLRDLTKNTNFVKSFISENSIILYQFLDFVAAAYCVCLFQEKFQIVLKYFVLPPISILKCCFSGVKIIFHIFPLLKTISRKNYARLILPLHNSKNKYVLIHNDHT